ncbi:MAG: hypothetical protein WDA42_02690 [Candidatus Bathyarchaeia archaeon]
MTKTTDFKAQKKQQKIQAYLWSVAHPLNMLMSLNWGAPSVKSSKPVMTD